MTVEFSDEAVSRIEGWLENAGSTCLLVLKRGQPVYQWGNIAHKSNVFSVRKSLLSALVGTAVERGEIELDRTLEGLGVDDKQSLTAVEKQATVRHLLKARSGIYHPSVYETERMLALKPPRHAHAPDEMFVYNNWDFNALGTIFEALTGVSIFEAFAERIAAPIGMEDYSPADGSYVEGRETIHRAYPIAMTTRDLARFAELFRLGGKWQGRQVIPAEWVSESTRPWSDADTGGYGYMWWTADSASGKPAEFPYPPGCYMARGNHGQYAVVFPAEQSVVVHRVDPAVYGKKVLRDQMPELLRFILRALEK